MKKSMKASVTMSLCEELKPGKSVAGWLERQSGRFYHFTEKVWGYRRKSLEIHRSPNLRIVHHEEGFYRVSIKFPDELVGNGLAALIRNRAEKAISVLESRCESDQIQLGLIILPKSA
jgi:hypothetical protein